MDEIMIRRLSLLLLSLLCTFSASESFPTTPFDRLRNNGKSAFGQGTNNSMSCAIAMEELQLGGYRRTCPVNNRQDQDCPRDDITIGVCCTCLDVCCSQFDYEYGSTNMGITFPDALRRTRRWTNAPEKVNSGQYTEKINPDGTKESSSSAVTIKDAGTKESSSSAVTIKDADATFNEWRTTRMRRTAASKATRGNGEAVNDDDDDKDKERGVTFGRKQFEQAIIRAELDDEEPDTDAMSTTAKPPPASCSSKSKRCDDKPEPDLLDEFFPPKKESDSKKDKGKGKRKRRDLTIELELMPLAKLKLGEVEDNDAVGTFRHISIGTDSTTEAMEATTESINATSSPVRMTQPESKNSPPANKTDGKNKDKPELVTTSMLAPNVKPGKCEMLTTKKACVSILPDAAQCTLDSECEGTKKCCFFGCKPYNKVGICSVPTMF